MVDRSGSAEALLLGGSSLRGIRNHGLRWVRNIEHWKAQHGTDMQQLTG